MYDWPLGPHQKFPPRRKLLSHPHRLPPSAKDVLELNVTGSTVEQAVPDGDLFKRQTLHGTEPEHVVLARFWRVGADWLDRNVQAERLDDQQSDLQGDRAVARFEARKDGGLYVRQARDALAAEP